VPSPGQTVPRKIIFRQGAAALLPPVLGFAAGFTLTGLFFPLSGEGLRIGAGAAFMFLLALGIYLFHRPSPESS
jgi:sigma-E factor negative regulatory protein RseC